MRKVKFRHFHYIIGQGNGFPIAAVVTTPEVGAVLTRALHFNTFGGNPLSCAVGSAVLDVIEEEKLQANSLEVGTFFLEELAKMRDEFKVLQDRRIYKRIINAPITCHIHNLSNDNLL